ncbi:hypothetical protein CLV48_11048 [Cecembia rubra]|uniref:Uncharacterized protein n=1 Tax=Cecembia rubra TaxID=1485585 RepID=A0A2P8DYG8_9BACT|nr:hypothetical protein CLV48_11048 [Cecembia rubra]
MAANNGCKALIAPLFLASLADKKLLEICKFVKRYRGFPIREIVILTTGLFMEGRRTIMKTDFETITLQSI